jgi:hypothetical protein
MPEGSLWIFGGLGPGDDPLDTIEIVSRNIATGVWAVKTYSLRMRRKIFGHCAVLDIDEQSDMRIVVSGGFHDGEYSSKVCVYAKQLPLE